MEETTLGTEEPLSGLMLTHAGQTTREAAVPVNDALVELYGRLLAKHGPQDWWPAESAFEMIVGAYLTQNTSWNNVSLALANLRAAGCLSVEGIRSASLEELQALVRPSGFFRQKAARLKAFVAMLDTDFRGDLVRLLALPTDELRSRLLRLHGVGRETADSIVLYAAHRPIFVIDLYTRRLFEREPICLDALTADYDELRGRIEAALVQVFPDDIERARIFNEYHALIVAEGKSQRIKRK